MHGRTVNGEAIVFGNAGGLYKNAMTWWDHRTESIWSQPIGEALSGPMKGTKLDLLPFQLTTWENWRSAHPQTQVMKDPSGLIGGFRERFNENFVIGVTVAGQAKAYPYHEVASRRLVEDQLGDLPILVWAQDDDYRVFLRRVEQEVLHFEWNEGNLVDKETGTRWDPRLGLARNGEYEGQALQQIPSFSSFASSWKDFYPEGEIYPP